MAGLILGFGWTNLLLSFTSTFVLISCCSSPLIKIRLKSAAKLFFLQRINIMQNQQRIWNKARRERERMNKAWAEYMNSSGGYFRIWIKNSVLIFDFARFTLVPKSTAGADSNDQHKLFFCTYSLAISWMRWGIQLSVFITLFPISHAALLLTWTWIF